MALRKQLEILRAEAGALYLSLIADAALQFDRTGVPREALQPGSAAPDFALPGPDGTLVSLAGILQSGPAVISFFRGEWCPFCRAELDALMAAQPEIARMGASLVMISPEPCSVKLAAEVARLGRRAHLLHDPMLGVALLYGIVYMVPDALKTFYLERGFDLSKELSTGSWLLPFPADFVVGVTGVVVDSYIDADFTRRGDPTRLLEALGAGTPAL